MKQRGNVIAGALGFLRQPSLRLLPLADVHLHRARLFDDRTALDAARKLIEETGYERRRGELDDAQCGLDGRAVVLPAFESLLAQARGENLPATLQGQPPVVAPDWHPRRIPGTPQAGLRYETRHRQT